MAIQMRRGNIADYDASMMRPGEIAVATDTEQVFVGMANGAVEIAKKSDLDSISDTILDAKVKALESIYGGEPSTVATVAEMTNTDLTYIYSGSETGYTAGHWYYWDGTAWMDGGQYASGMILDEISEGILESYVTEGSYTSAGVTTERISDTELKVYGTCTGNRRFNVYNGFQTVRTTTSPFQEMLPAGTYRVSLSANKTVGNPRVTFSYSTYADALWTILNGQTVVYEFVQPFMFGFYANTNINYGTADDPTIVTLRIESITAKDEVARAKVDSIAISETVSGSVVAFPDGADGYPVKSLTVAVEPVQSGSGDPSPSNIRPISGWGEIKITRVGKNLLESDGLIRTTNNVFIKNTDGSYTFTHVGSGFANRSSAQAPVNIPSGKTITVSFKYSGTITSAFSIRFASSDGTYADYSNLTLSDGIASCTLTLTKDDIGAEFYFGSGGVGEALTITDIQIEYGSTATDYEPYTDKEYTISIGETVYGGTLDVVNGKMIVSTAIITSPIIANVGEASTGASYARTATQSALNIAMCSAYKVRVESGAPQTGVSEIRLYNNYFYFYGDEFAGKTVEQATALLDGVQVLYTLATPIEISLTPTQVTTLLGGNTIWADAGDVSVEYVADTKLFILKVIGS